MLILTIGGPQLVLFTIVQDFLPFSWHETLLPILNSDLSLGLQYAV